jgi:AcrR family transcriptional regulator
MAERATAKAAMRERILETADRLFYGRGIRAVGVDTVAEAIGISKRTLYNHFPSKDALVAAYLERRFNTLPITDQPPAEQILGNFDRLGRILTDKGFRGCPFVNAVAEIGEPGHEANKLAIAFKEQRRLWFRELLQRLKVKDADALAGQLQMLVDGAIATMLVRGDPAIAKAAKDAACTLLAAAGIRLPKAEPMVAGRRRR